MNLTPEINSAPVLVPLAAHAYHAAHGARFAEVRGSEVVDSYGDVAGEYAALHSGAGILDLSMRGRLCLTGADRQRFLHGQVTNNVQDLKAGQGCYAALITAKGRMQSDLNIYSLENELLLDFEPGLAAAISQRLDKYIIADDVQIVDISALYALLSVQGPKSAALVSAGGFLLPEGGDRCFARTEHPDFGESYVVNHSRTEMAGLDLFVPSAALTAALDRLRSGGATPCGWHALEIARVESGIPRFGADMDETNLPPETGVETRAISYNKGCYIGQEVIARLRTYGQVAKALRGLRLDDASTHLPERGDKIFFAEKEIGYITSSVRSPKLNATIALGYVRRERNAIGTRLRVKSKETVAEAMIVELPFVGS